MPLTVTVAESLKANTVPVYSAHVVRAAEREKGNVSRVYRKKTTCVHQCTVEDLGLGFFIVSQSWHQREV